MLQKLHNETYHPYVLVLNTQIDHRRLVLFTSHELWRYGNTRQYN